MESEKYVQAALANLMQGRTVFVIAHRLVDRAASLSKIAVIERGKITETGTHEELMQNSGTYRRLYDMQFSDDDRIGGWRMMLHSELAAVEGICVKCDLTR